MGDSDEEQEGCDQPPDLLGVLLVIMVRESLIALGSNHPWELKEGGSGVECKGHRVVYIHLPVPRRGTKRLE